MYSWLVISLEKINFFWQVLTIASEVSWNISIFSIFQERAVAWLDFVNTTFTQRNVLLFLFFRGHLIL